MHDIIKFQKDPILFIESLLTTREGAPFVLHEGQKEFLRNIQRLTVGCWGRQAGKSVMLGGYGTWYASTHANREVYVIAPTVDQSRIIFNEIAAHFRKPPLKSLVVGKIKEYPFPHIRLVNGTNVHGRGANSPEYIRGKPIHLGLLDEAAFFKDGVIPQVIEPMFTVTGKMEHSGMILISTPFGQGDFYEYAERARRGNNSYFSHFTSLDNPHADLDYLNSVKETYGEDSLLWRTEYLAEFVDGDLAVFPWTQIKKAIERYPYQNFPVAPQEGHRYVQGVDLANVRDYFVSTILDTTDPSLVPLVDMERAQKKGYTYYKNVIRGKRSSYNHAKTLIDATSLGESVVEDLADISAEGYKFSNQSKWEVVQELSRMFSENRIAIPNDRKIIDELRYFQYEITPSKKITMEAKRGHDDIVMSLALAAHLALIPKTVGFFQPVPGLNPEVRARTTKAKTRDPFAELFEINEEDDAYTIV
jgi:hypothetical protein